MLDNAIIIRSAEISDIDLIWQLLHVDCKTWNTEMIATRLKELTVLTYQNKILGVFYGNISAHKIEPFWIAVHPSYPESSIGTVIYYALLGVLNRQPINNLK